MILNFKKWLNLRESYIRYNYANESFSDTAFYIGNAVSTDDGSKAFEDAFTKIDKYIGLNKFLYSIPKTVYANVKFVIAVYKFSNNPSNAKALNEVLKWAVEAGKISVYSGSTVPLGAILGNIISPGIGEIIGTSLAKAVSYSYFYMGQWADNNIDNQNLKIASIAKSIKKIMPGNYEIFKNEIEGK